MTVASNVSFHRLILSGSTAYAGTPAASIGHLIYSTNSHLYLVDDAAVTTDLGGVGAGALTISAGTQSLAGGSVVISNSNGIGFGLSASTLTASANALVSIIGNTTGTSGTSTYNIQAMPMSGAGGVSLGHSAGTIIVSGATGGGAGGIGAISAGTQSVSTGSIVFSNSNGISFGMSGSTRITASHNALTTAAASNHSHGNPTLALTNLSGTTASNSAGLTLSLSAGAGGGGTATISAGTSSAALGSIVFSDSNGISFGLNGSTITGSHNALTSQSNQAFSAGAASSTFQTVSFQDSNGISFSNNAGAIRLTHDLQFTSATSAITSAALHTSASRVFNIVAATNSTGGGTASLSSNVSFSNTHGLSFWTSAGSAIVGSYTVPTVPSIGTSLEAVASASSVGTVTRYAAEDHRHAGLNTVSLVGNTAGATSAGAGSLILAGGPNITLSASTAAGGMTVSVSGGAGAAADGGVFIAAGTRTAASTATVVFSESNGITFGLNTTGGSIITASHNALTVQSNQTLGAYVSSQSTGASSSSTFDARSFSFAGSGGVSIGASNNSWVVQGQDPRGLHTIWVPASAMYARVTNGAAPGSVEMTTNQNMLRTWDFDTSTDEFVQFTVAMPSGWNEGTITFIPVWSHAATTTNFGVAWFLQAVAVANDDVQDVAFGTAQSSVDTGGTTNDVYMGPTSSAVTVAGSPAAGELVMFQIYRDVSDGGDTMAIDARLQGVKILYTTDAATDA